MADIKRRIQALEDLADLASSRRHTAYKEWLADPKDIEANKKLSHATGYQYALQIALEVLRGERYA